MKIRNPKLISCVAWVAAQAIRGWVGTVRTRYAPLGRALTPVTPGLSERFIYTFWHDSLLLPARLYGHTRTPVSVLISQHADGQLISETAEKLGYQTLRGSTTRGGIEALRQMLQASQTNHIVVTPDGPRGPRRVMQGGAIFVASRTGLPIVPTGIGYDKPWRARSWDRFAVPRPMSRAVVVTGNPISVPAKANAEVLEAYRMRVQAAMDEVNTRAEAIFAGASTAQRRAA